MEKYVKLSDVLDEISKLTIEPSTPDGSIQKFSLMERIGKLYSITN